MSIKKKFFPAFLLFCVVLVTGCGMRNIIVNYVPKEADSFARSYLELLRKGDIDAAVASMDKEAAETEARQKIAEAAKQLDKGNLLGAEVLKFYNMKWFFSKDKKTLIDYQLQFERGWAEAVVVVDDTNGKRSVSGLYVETLPKSLRDIHGERFYEKPLSQYVLAGLMLLIPVFVFYTFILCITSPAKYKILWLLFICVGIGSLSIDWTTGLLGLHAFALTFFGASVVKDGIYGPWIITGSFPLGALVFHLYRRTMIQHANKLAKGA